MILRIIHHKVNIKFEDRGTIYTIPLSDILYVTKESNDRKCIIKTANSEFKINLTLKEVVELCDNKLIQTHRSCFVNMDRVRMIDKRENVIVFDNGLSIDMLSSTYKKGIGV